MEASGGADEAELSATNNEIPDKGEQQEQKVERDEPNQNTQTAEESPTTLDESKAETQTDGNGSTENRETDGNGSNQNCESESLTGQTEPRPSDEMVEKYSESESVLCNEPPVPSDLEESGQKVEQSERENDMNATGGGENLPSEQVKQEQEQQPLDDDPRTLNNSGVANGGTLPMNNEIKNDPYSFEEEINSNNFVMKNENGTNINENNMEYGKKALINQQQQHQANHHHHRFSQSRDSTSDFTEEDEEEEDFDEEDDDEEDYDYVDNNQQERKDYRLGHHEFEKKHFDNIQGGFPLQQQQQQQHPNQPPQEKKRRKVRNRFNGMPEEEVAKRLLPDLLAKDLDILVIGINPGMYAAFKGHHYAGPGNHFWKCMFLSGIIPHPMSADDDHKLLEKGIGFTNIVARTTKSSVNLSRQEIVEGTSILLEKIRTFKPKIACFNGKGIYEVFCGKKEFHFGKQPDVIEGTDTHVWVMPNSSARCAQLPRAVDKAPFYEALRKFRDYLKGNLDTLDDSEVVFSNFKLKNFNEGSPKKKLEQMMMSNADYKPHHLQQQHQQQGSGDDNSNGCFDTSESGDLEYRVDPLTGKKKRGRPPKPRPDGSVPAPKRRILDADGNPIPRGSNPIDPLTGKKKRGRPKKCDLPPGAPPAPYRKKKKLLDKAKEENCNSSSSSLMDMSNVNSMNSKPTKIVPPLPPFSPHFGMKEEEKPIDLKSHNKSYPTNNDHSNMHGNDGRLHNPCDYSGRLPQPEDYSTNSGYHHYQQQQQQQQQSSEQQQQQQHQLKSSENQSGYSTSHSSPPNNSYPPPGAYPGNAPAVGNHHGTTKNADDVSSKSITGLESLVDQIPALAENDSGVFSGSGAGSHPNTPRSVGPYSPSPAAAHFQSSFHPPPSHSTSSFEGLDNSTNNATPGGVSNHTDFSVSSLVHNSSTLSSSAAASAAAAAAAAASVSASTHLDNVSSDPFYVSSLASAEATMAAASKYPGLAGSNPYMFHSSPGSSFGSGGFLSGANSFPGGHPMASMGAMGAMAGMSYYGQYPNGPYGGSAPGLGPSPYTHGLPMPNPSYPYPSPYGQSPYSQSPYF